ncbi:MAG: trigger factor, partial [Clostridia bacterium]|nr:trigger factor [Clostridia bacterium]
VTFPENYHVADLAGKPAKFEVKVNAVKAKELPEINDAFVSDISEFETLDAYKEHIKADLKKRNEDSAKMETENKIIEAIVKEMEVDVPEVMINDELDNIMRDMEYRLMYQGANLETYAKYMNKTVEELRQDRRADAEKSVKVRLALQNILALEKIDIKDKEIDAKIEEIATRVNKPLDEYKKTISEERVSYIKNQILMDKLLAFLVDNNK